MSVVIYMTLWDVARFGDFLVWACPTCEKIRSVYSLNTHRYVSADFGRCFVMLCCRMAVIKSSQVKITVVALFAPGRVGPLSLVPCADLSPEMLDARSCS
jgi:hypothetical protein